MPNIMKAAASTRNVSNQTLPTDLELQTVGTRDRHRTVISIHFLIVRTTDE